MAAHFLLMGPITLMRRVVKPAKRDVLGRCPVCGGDVVPDSPVVHLRGLHVHRHCATYRVRQRSRLR